MRFLTLGLAALAFVGVMDVHTSSAQRSIVYPWCLDHGSSEGFFYDLRFQYLCSVRADRPWRRRDLLPQSGISPCGRAI